MKRRLKIAKDQVSKRCKLQSLLSVSNGPIETNFESISKWRRIYKIGLRISILVKVQRKEKSVILGLVAPEGLSSPWQPSLVDSSAN